MNSWKEKIKRKKPNIWISTWKIPSNMRKYASCRINYKQILFYSRQSSNVNQQQQHENTEIIMNLEKKIAELQLNLQKQERDSSFKDEELKNMRKFAKEAAEQLQPLKDKENEYLRIIQDRDLIIQQKDEQMIYLNSQIDGIRQEYLQKIKYLEQELNLKNMETNSLIDIKLNNEQEFEKKEKTILSLEQKIQDLDEKIKDQDIALKKMGETLFSKGVENKRLVEIVNEFKNEHLFSKVMGQKYSVQKIGSLKNEDLIDGQYFIDILKQKGQKLVKQICIADIYAFKNLQATKFELTYYSNKRGTLFFGKGEQLKSEQFQSRHLADIQETISQIQNLIEQEDYKLDEHFEQNKSQSGIRMQFTRKNKFRDEKDDEESKSSDEDKFVYVKANQKQQEVIQHNYISDDHHNQSDDDYDDEESDESQNSL
ncbi:UNKNOWN [Stylonychia lemnae]|uniref:Uncharacterized protein n=1 Tax=Stylonychia lemnae TaxID=5949 RepID=A0A078B9A2_STYLE|nr:UNKNOWN [Stylonychia lemnae]|eukprot:CDW90811.1 UNKNOWN [Stylonychia lemnae]